MRHPRSIAAALLAAALLAPSAGADVVEEIVAWVNGDIITRSELEEEEQVVIAEAYRRYTGEELDRQVKAIRENQLLQMIDRKILLSRIERVYDIDAMKEAFYEQFRTQQGLDSEEELLQALEQEGMTLDELKDRLLEMFAPEEAVRLEVGRRIAVGEAELHRYYDENPEEFVPNQQVTLSEIVLMASSPEDKERRRAEAQAIHDRVADGGEPFAEVAAEVSEAGTAERGGELGVLKKGDLSGKLENAAFGIPVGTVSDILEMPYGFHIIKVDDRTSSEPRPFEQVADDLRRRLEDEKYFTELAIYKKKIRGEAEWCVKAAFADRVPDASRENVCAGL